ncbi:MAG: carbohydrate ABC transporter permease [Spirochaetales bacterium]|nr:carbohydrate ABC transporter permease [Spirochaetales bacterium]
MGAHLKGRLSPGEWVVRCLLAISALVIIFPLLWTFYTSFKTNEEFLGSIWSLPKVWNWDNYIRAFEVAKIGSYFINSIFLTLMAIAFMFLMGLPAAYILSRMEFRFRKVIFAFFMSGMFISTTYTVLPIFLMLNKVKLLNNLPVLAFVYAATTLSYNIFLMAGFFRGISKDYEDAAEIDGCGYLQKIGLVIVPLSRSGLFVVVLFAFMSYWNEYVLGFTVLRDRALMTLPIGLANLMEIQQFATDWGAMFAGLVTVMIPTMLVYIFVQKYLTAGISIGGLKG